MIILRRHIIPDPNQPRKTFSPKKLGELKDSMTEEGPDQPLTVRPIANGQYMIITGERRWRVCENDEMECVVRDVNDKTAREIQFRENLQREDIDPVEMGEAFWEYRQKYEVTQQELAKMIGVTQPFISEREALHTSLTSGVKKQVSDKKLGASEGTMIATLSKKKQAQAAKAVIDHDLKRPEVQQLVTQVKAEPERSLLSIVQDIKHGREEEEAKKPVPVIPQTDRRKEVRDLFDQYAITPTLAPRIAEAVIRQPERLVLDIVKDEIPGFGRMLEVRAERIASITLGAYRDAGKVAEDYYGVLGLLSPKPEPGTEVFAGQLKKLRKRLNETLVKLGHPDEVTAAEKRLSAKKEDKAGKP